MSVKHISCILFDFDGVLIDSLPVMEIAWNSVRKKFCIPNNFIEYKRYIGLPFNKILLKLNIDKNLYPSIKEHYSIISSSNKRLIKLNPYVKDVLDWLNAKSIAVGIVTSKDKVRTYELVEYFQLNIEAIVTPELTKLGKPSSEPILYAARYLNINLNQIIFIGDMQSDMICAFNSNCSYLHYTNGYQQLSHQMYGGQISSIKDIIEYVKNI